MSRDIDPFANDSGEGHDPVVEEVPVNNRLGMSNVRQALSRWWVMLVFGILGYLSALYYMSVLPPSYTATALVEVDTKDKVLIGADLEQGRADLNLLMANVLSRITAPTALLEVAEHPRVQALPAAIPPKFSLKPRYSRSEDELEFGAADSVDVGELASKIGRWIEIEIRRNTSIMEISVVHPDEHTAKVVADVVAEAFMEKEEARLLGDSSDAFSLLKREADAEREEMELAEKSLKFYVAAVKLSEQIQAKRAEILVIRQRYLPKHPTRIQEELVYADLIKRFGREIKRSSEKATEKVFWLEYKDQLDALEQVITSGEGDEIAEAVDEWVLLAQSALSSRASILETSIEQKRAQYQTISKRMTEIDIQDEDKMSKFTLLEEAFVSQAKGTVEVKFLAIGTVFGVAVGFGLAYLLSVIDYKIYDVRSAEEATGLACMAAIPASSRFGRNKEWRSVLEEESNSANAEAIRNLRASIVLLGKQERNKVLLVTSAIPGEGKTTVSAELAAAFALNKERTLLVDLDMRRPKLTETMPHLRGAPGIVEVLAGQAELDGVLHDSNIEHLKVIGSGDRAPNPSELLHEGEFVSILEQLRPQFDRIILDSAPVLPVSDSRLLAKHAQAVILVVRSRKTPIGAMIRARDLLKQAGAKMGGVVVNGMKRHGGGKYYGYKGFGEYGADDYGYYGGDK